MNDGWIEWNGGIRPVDGECLVEIIVRADIGAIAGVTVPAKSANWEHSGSGSDIIAYRLHKREFKVGDKVTSITYGKGVVIDETHSSPYPVNVLFGKDQKECFTSSGCIFDDTTTVDLYHGHGTFKVEFIPDPSPVYEYQWEFWHMIGGEKQLEVTASFYTNEKHMLSVMASDNRFDFKRRDDTKREVK